MAMREFSLKNVSDSMGYPCDLSLQMNQISRLILIPLMITTCLAQQESGLIFETGFEDEAWKKNFKGIERETIKIVDKGHSPLYLPHSGKALEILTPKNAHYGASIEFPFKNTKGGEPTEIYFRYYLRFGADWNPTGGGKLPGIGATYGQGGWGGRPSNGKNGWSSRGLFGPQKNGKTPIGFYCYHADMKGKYGEHWLWEKDQLGFLENNRWYCIEQYAKLNSIDQNDGILRGWIDGKLAFENTKIRMRRSPDIKIQNIWINVYHGGADPSSSEDRLYIDDIVISRHPIGPKSSP